MQNTNFYKSSAGDISKAGHLVGKKAKNDRKRIEIYLVHLLVNYPCQRFNKWEHFFLIH